eukprot:29008-Pelagococcus_subviridis.AAC.3
MAFTTRTRSYGDQCIERAFSSNVGATSTATKFECLPRGVCPATPPIRTMRCAPFSLARYPYANRPSISSVTDRRPTSSPGVRASTRTANPRRRAHAT